MSLDNIKEKYNLAKQNLLGDREINLSLTGHDSHLLFSPAGVGSVVIGTKGIHEEKVDLLVESDDVINWDAFNGLYTPAGYTEQKEYPYGNFPRWFYYYGNDLGFIDWSKKRKIEGFDITPSKDMIIDLRKANISTFTIHNKDNNIELLLGRGVRRLELYGYIEKINITYCEDYPSIMVDYTESNNKDIFKLPHFTALKDLTEIVINNSAVRAPFDCSSLLAYPKLKELRLIGNLTNLESLAQLKAIAFIGIWECPDLSGMPSLKTWDNLNEFVAVNIDETKGQEFREELKVLKKSKKIDSSVCSLRNKQWFETNYGIPFAYWEAKNEKKATRAYKTCLNNIKKALSKEDIKKEIVAFTNKINRLENIETQERDDTYEALCIIMKNSPILIDDEEWGEWFDETRNF